MSARKGRRRAWRGDGLRQGAPWMWAVLLVGASPWLRVQWGAWPLYPGYWALTIIVILYLNRSRAPIPRTPPPLKPLLLLAAWMTGLAALRGQWLLASVVAGGAAAHYAWGCAAQRLGREPHLEPRLARAVPLTLGVALLLGLLTAAGGALWPPLCRVLSCDPGASFPPSFQGIWLDPEQFWLFLILGLPTLGSLLVLRVRGQVQEPGLPGLLVLVAATLTAMLTAASLALLVLLVAAGAGMALALLPEHHAADRRLLLGLSLFVLVAAVVLYGAVPAYLQRLGTQQATGRVLLSPAAPPPQLIAPRATAPLALRVANTGWRTLSADPAHPASLAVRILFTDRLGTTRLAQERLVPLPQALPPHATLPLEAPLDVPPWLRGGFVSLQVLDGQGRLVPHDSASFTGFRYHNPAFRTLSDERDNWLSPLAQRARILARMPVAAAALRPDPNRADRVLGDLLDVLVFAPIWGARLDSGAVPFPFHVSRPILAQIFHGYGLIGVLLAGWALWDPARRALWMARGGTRRAPLLGWRLVPLAMALLALSGLFWNALGSFHGVWGLFLLAGYIEGRHVQLAPPRRIWGAAGWRLPGRPGWLRLPRLPRRPRRAIRRRRPPYRRPT